MAWSLQKSKSNDHDESLTVNAILNRYSYILQFLFTESEYDDDDIGTV